MTWCGARRSRLGAAIAGLLVATTATAATGCGTTIAGTPTWPGARLERSVLTAADFPPGVDYGRIVENPRQPDNAGGPAAMLSVPQGCSNGLTDVIAQSAERGPGSAAKYAVNYDGARVVMTVLTWPLDLDALSATASRCEHFTAYFDQGSAGIPMTTAKLPAARPGQLLYQQTMQLNNSQSSVFMSFENIDRMAVFGMAFPATLSGSDGAGVPKAELPQTFIDIVNKQAGKVRSG